MSTDFSHLFTDLDLSLGNHYSGKVRETYALDGGRRLLVTTDRLSGFDRILGAVKFKGQVLNQLSAWWFTETRDVVANHVMSLPDENALLAIDADPLPVEVVVRGYITGVTSTSIWTMYEAGDRVLYGHRFPDGLQKNQRLVEPIITPTTKAPKGEHDEPVTCAEVVSLGLLDAELWARVQEAALALFARGQKVAESVGLILADTKYEFGLSPAGALMLIDEVHTPDSSRYWRGDNYPSLLAAGQEPESFDKEIIRRAFREAGFSGDGPIPDLGPGLWESLSHRYIELFELLTGESFVGGSYPVQPRLEQNLRSAGLLEES